MPKFIMYHKATGEKNSFRKKVHSIKAVFGSKRDKSLLPDKV